jgi:YaiO family outer membrane protein
MTLLSVVLLSIALTSEPQTTDRRAEAERLARSGARAEALKLFQAIASENPDDIAARMWIARLHAEMGHPERAADVYQSIVSAQPQNLEALVGLGSALTAAGQLRAAASALERAEAAAKDNPAVLAAQGDLHRVSGRTTLALAYYERALLINAKDENARAARDAMRAERAHRVEGTYYYEHYNSDLAPDTHSGALEVNARASDSVRLFGVGQHLRKFDRDESRGGGGMTVRYHGNFQFDASVLGGGDRVLPELETKFGVGYSSGRVRWLADLRYLDFEDSTTTVLSPGVTVTIDPSAFLTVRYYRSETSVDPLTSNVGNDGFAARLSVLPSPRLTINGGYIHGFEGLTYITSERLTQHDADTVSTGFLFDVAPMTSIGATYEHQWWSDTTRVSTLFVTFIQRF